MSCTISYANSSPAISPSVAPLWVKATYSPGDVVDPAEHRFAVSRDGFRPDAAPGGGQRRMAGQHPGGLRQQLLDHAVGNPIAAVGRPW